MPKYLISDDERVNSLVEKIIAAEPYRAPKQDVTEVWASRVSACIRRQWYEMSNIEPDPDAEEQKPISKFIMAFGNLFEQVVTEQMQFLGVWRKKGRVKNRELSISGETDPIAFFEGDKILFEIKSEHRKKFHYTLREFKQGSCRPEYYSQIQTYLWLLTDIDYGVILVGNRDMIPSDTIPQIIWKRVDRDLEWQKENKERLVSLRTHLANKTIPDREFVLSDWQCQYCSFKNQCWGLDISEENNVGGRESY